MLPIIEFTTATGETYEATDVDYRSSQQSPRWFQSVRAVRLDSCQ